MADPFRIYTWLGSTRAHRLRRSGKILARASCLHSCLGHAHQARRAACARPYRRRRIRFALDRVQLYSRFLTPALVLLLGWALFCDQTSSLARTTSPACRVHQGFPRRSIAFSTITVRQEKIKMDGALQTVYPRKNHRQADAAVQLRPPVGARADPRPPHSDWRLSAPHAQWLKDQDIGKKRRSELARRLEPEAGMVRRRPCTSTRGGPWFDNW